MWKWLKTMLPQLKTLILNRWIQFLDDKYMGLGPSYGDTIYKDQAIANWKYYVENLYEKIQYTTLTICTRYHHGRRRQR